MGDMLKGDSPAPSANTNASQMLQAYTKYLPGLLQATSATALPVGQNLLNAQQQLDPKTQQLQYDIYNQFNPQYQASSNNANLAALQGSGGQSVLAADKLNRQIDPSYYGSRDIASNKLNELISGQDPNKLTGAEMTNAERGINRLNNSSGNAGVPNNSNTIANALSFDDRLQQKRAGVSQAINSASQLLPNLRSGTDTFGQATGQQGTQAFQSQFSQPSQVGQQSFNTGNSFLGGLQNNQTNSNNINANRRTVYDAVNQSYGAATGGASSMCCFIFLEVYNGKLPEFVRECRDEYYYKQPRVAVGYKRMAKWLVPFMRKSKLVKTIINLTMVKPITAFGGWKKGVDGYKLGWLAYPFKAIWFNVWKISSFK